MSNQILIKHPRNWGLDEVMVTKLALEALRKKQLTGIELSVNFVGRKKAYDLNVNYRNKSYIPQVLGFPMSQEMDSDRLIRLGDVVICTQKLKTEAKMLHKDIYIILAEWMVHGVENLLKG